MQNRIQKLKILNSAVSVVLPVKSCAFYEDVFPIPGNLKEYSIVY